MRKELLIGDNVPVSEVEALIAGDRRFAMILKLRTLSETFEKGITDDTKEQFQTLANLNNHLNRAKKNINLVRSKFWLS